MAAPDTNNIFTWYFIVFGLQDYPWKGGYYLGKLVFPQDYPWKPPAIMMITETGRFKTNERICLSISDYHPESWNPVWPVRSIIIGLISFFVTDMHTVGSIREMTKPQQAKIAEGSKQKIMQHKIYKDLFETYAGNIGLSDGTSHPKQVVPAQKPEIEESKQAGPSVEIGKLPEPPA